MILSRFFSLIATCLLLTAALLVQNGIAGELIDNAKLMEMISGNLSPKVVMATITASSKDCRFTALVKDKVAIQAACTKATTEPKWTQPEIDALLLEVGRLSSQSQTDLRNLVNLFLTSVENGDDETVQQYRELMGKLVRAGSTVVPNLRDNLSLESDRKRAGVLKALGRVGEKTPELLKDIMLLLDDPINPVRVEAAKTVAILSNSETGDRLVTMLARRENKNDGVALALGYMRYEAAIPALVQVLKTSRESDDRICAAFALGEMRAKTSGATDQLLLGVLDDRDEKLRAVCAKSLGLIGDKRTPAYVTKAFDRFRSGRAGVLDSLRYFRTIYVVKFLAETLEGDNDNDVRKLAMTLLENLTGEKYDTKDQWLAFIELLALRPDWQEVKETNKLPEPQEPEVKAN